MREPWKARLAPLETATISRVFRRISYILYDACPSNFLILTPQSLQRQDLATFSEACSCQSGRPVPSSAAVAAADLLTKPPRTFLKSQTTFTLHRQNGPHSSLFLSFASPSRFHLATFLLFRMATVARSARAHMSLAMPTTRRVAGIPCGIEQPTHPTDEFGPQHKLWQLQECLRHGRPIGQQAGVLHVQPQHQSPNSPSQTASLNRLPMQLSR